MATDRSVGIESVFGESLKRQDTGREKKVQRHVFASGRTVVCFGTRPDVFSTTWIAGVIALFRVDASLRCIMPRFLFLPSPARRSISVHSPITCASLQIYAKIKKIEICRGACGGCEIMVQAQDPVTVSFEPYLPR